MRNLFIIVFFSCVLIVSSNLSAAERLDNAQLTIDSLSSKVALLERKIEYLSMENQYSSIKNDMSHYTYDSKILLLELENLWQDVKYDSRKRDYTDRQLLNSRQEMFDSYRTAINTIKELYAHAILKDYLLRQKYEFDETEINLLDAQISSINSSFDLIQQCFSSIELYLKELNRFY